MNINRLEDMNLSVVFLILALGISACHKSVPLVEKPAKVSNEGSGAADQFPKESTYESDCDKWKKHFSLKSSYVEQYKDVLITREKQRVIRKDCSGEVVSDKIETVKDPHYSLALEPNIRIGKVGAVEVFNASTCLAAGAELPLKGYIFTDALFPVTGDEFGKIQLKLDMARAVFTFKVDEGRNDIHFTYYSSCLPDSAASIRHNLTGRFCKADEKNKEVLSGIYRVTVSYKEIELNGTKLVEPSEASCRELKNKEKENIK